MRNWIMARAHARLAHGWKLSAGPEISATLIREFIRPAIRAVPPSLAERLGPARMTLAAGNEPGVASQWTFTESQLELFVNVEGVEEHDVALELLVCLGQSLWDRLEEAEVRTFWALLRDEIEAGINGEIDEEALEEKRSLFESRPHADSAECLARYGRASFAGTAAEYVHSLWHDVTVRTGPEHLPARALRRRLELISRWFPPGRGYRLFPAGQ